MFVIMLLSSLVSVSMQEISGSEKQANFKVTITIIAPISTFLLKY